MSDIRLWWWRWRHPYDLNFGDEVSAPLLERLTGRRVVWTPLERADVVAAGSVLQIAIARRRASLPVIWGSGFIEPQTYDSLDDLAPRAVRGTSTAAYFSEAVRANLQLGDPGLLAATLVDGPVRKRYSLGVIPHYTDASHPWVGQIAKHSGVRVIDVAWTPEEVAREISACDAVVSSSLHGLIFADALGVPNARLVLHGKLAGGDFKFDDYTSVFDGDRSQTVLTSDALAGLEPSALVELVGARYQEPRGLERVLAGLTSVLP
ncbi:polysaccharide pyruvyl transferase family protein [Cellulomonas edaphi]|uniref:Polysaccharide pyruvyl transferase family protein n=1 Tax=Cellulomonas edaphi TaxID=3053468 RepID=A0ABT7S7Z3_9CELL|nr:polysaccharide pyruvyl transferase family protein [Cellulomons edaphi]MDM7831748.1 polysaccharide pyruvyl transferase family protein [Cellulomons edaphi]